MHNQTVFAKFPSQLTNTFDVRKRFDIAHSTTDFGNYKIEIAFITQEFNIAFDFVGNVRNNLHSFAQVITTTFLVDDILINAAGGHIISFVRLHTQKAFVMPKVEVGLMSIHCYIALTVFVGIKSSRIHIDIRVEFLVGNSKTTGLQQFSQRCSNNAFS